MDLNIAFFQLLPGKTQEENLEKGLQACREAKKQGADIALFPEIWNIGYDIDQEPDMLRKLAVSVDSPFVTAFQKLAKELQMAIGITFLESYHPAPRNTICLFDMYGKRTGRTWFPMFSCNKSSTFLCRSHRKRLAI